MSKTVHKPMENDRCLLTSLVVTKQSKNPKRLRRAVAGRRVERLIDSLACGDKWSCIPLHNASSDHAVLFWSVHGEHMRVLNALEPL